MRRLSDIQWILQAGDNYYSPKTYETVSEGTIMVVSLTDRKTIFEVKEIKDILGVMMLVALEGSIVQMDPTKEVFIPYREETDGPLSYSLGNSRLPFEYELLFYEKTCRL